MLLFSYFLQHNRYMNLIGILVVLAIAVFFSRKRHAINTKLILNALGLQFLIALFVLRVPLGRSVINGIAGVVQGLYECAGVGIDFVFGGLANPASSWGFVFAIKVLPIIVFFGAFMSLLFHWGIVQRVVYVISIVIRPLLGTSGAETLCAISNSFLGQTEAPLLVKNYLKDMTRSEMLVVMVSGMGTISGGILAVFAAMGVPAVHLLSASVMAIPGSILMAKILYPETERSKTSSGATVDFASDSGNMFSAISSGTTDGLQLALNVGAMLIAFLSLIALINIGLGYVSATINYIFAIAGSGIAMPTLSLSYIFSYLLSPFGYLLGFTGTEAFQIGELLGIKVTGNELIAYSRMLEMNLSERAVSLVTYALCGFANFSCIGIQLGGIGVLVPSKREWLSEFGLLTVLGASLSNLLSALIAGLIL